MNFENRVLPYISLGLVTFMCFVASYFVGSDDVKSVLLAVGANGLFFFLAYFFYDYVKQKILKEELNYIHQHIRQQISSSIFCYLYFVKKVIYGYNLDTNTPDNILGIAGLKKSEIENHIVNQSYLGFQIYKSSAEVTNLFQEIAKDNIFLKFSSHLDSIGILKISNNLRKLELLYKNPSNFILSAEKGIKYRVVDGKSINPENDEKLLLLKVTGHDSRFVVYDSGYFDKPDYEVLLNRYVLKPEIAHLVSEVMDETLALMRDWLPEPNEIDHQEKRFRILKGFFSEKTDIKDKKSSIFVADIIESKNSI